MKMQGTDFKSLTGAFKSSLDRWAKNTPSYAKLYANMSKEIISVAHDALEEMQAIKPGAYEIWWMTHHMRYVKKYRQRDLMLLHEIMYHFLSAFARGELEQNINESASTKRKAKPGPKPELSANQL